MAVKEILIKVLMPKDLQADPVEPATATPQDVLEGKTYYSNSRVKKVGQLRKRSLSVKSGEDEQVFTASTDEVFDEVTVAPLKLSETAVTASFNLQEITPESPYEGFSKVMINPISSDVDVNITPNNIVKGVTILGVEGNVERDKPDQEKTATPTKQTQEITADIGYELSKVTINPIPNDYIRPEGSLTITENGTYNVREKLNVVVNKTDKLNQFLRKTITEITAADLEGVTEIGYQAFSGYSSLTSVEIPSSVTIIGSYAFYNCSSLTSITIPEGVTDITNGVFAGCSSLTSVIIPSGLTSIGYEAFNDCSSLTSITIPNNVRSIGSWAFSGCSSLANIRIPSNVTFIDSAVLRGCSSLESIIVENDNPAYDSRNNCNAIIETFTNALIAACTNTIIPNDITSLGNYSFSGCTSLESIIIPESVTSIGDCAFDGCSSLTSVTLSSNITCINYGTFRNCTSLTDIIIPEGVTSIGSDAFISCHALTSIEIPNSVTSIGGMVFFGCESLREVKIGSGLTDLNSAFWAAYHISLFDFRESLQVVSLPDIFFFNYAPNCKIVVPDALYNDWITSTNWVALTDVQFIRASEYVEE